MGWSEWFVFTMELTEEEEEEEEELHNAYNNVNFESKIWYQLEFKQTQIKLMYVEFIWGNSQKSHLSNYKLHND